MLMYECSAIIAKSKVLDVDFTNFTASKFGIIAKA